MCSSRTRLRIRVGDTVYLDNKPFEITDIRDFHVELRDPSLLYPVSRLENRDNFTQLLAQDERNSAFIPGEPEPGTDYCCPDRQLSHYE